MITFYASATLFLLTLIITIIYVRTRNDKGTDNTRAEDRFALRHCSDWYCLYGAQKEREKAKKY